MLAKSLLMLTAVIAALLPLQIMGSSPKSALTDNGMVHLVSGPLGVTVDANVGARIISFTYQGMEILTQPSVTAMSYGSTFWDAPQSRWQWPPPATLDSAPYTAHIDGDKIILTSAVDASSGLQFVKQLRLAGQPVHLEVTYTIKNAGSQTIQAGPWEITRVPGGLTFFPFDKVEKLPDSNLPDVTTSNGITWYNFTKASLAKDKKGFFGACEGWLANVTPGKLLFLKSFRAVNAAQYPPGQAAVEIYGHDLGDYTELENHGPFTILKPDESLDYVVRWTAQPIPAAIDVAPGNEALVQFARALSRSVVKQ